MERVSREETRVRKEERVDLEKGKDGGWGDLILSIWLRYWMVALHGVPMDIRVSHEPTLAYGVSIAKHEPSERNEVIFLSGVYAHIIHSSFRDTRLVFLPQRPQYCQYSNQSIHLPFLH